MLFARTTHAYRMVMGHMVDPETGMAEVFNLWAAENAEALHKALLLFQPIRQTSDAFEPIGLLRKHHETEPQMSAATALLLLTDRRWRGGVGHLIREIETSGILDEEELGALADTFLAADDAVFWPVPDDWFDDGVTITIEKPAGAEIDADVDVEDEVTGQPVARRDVWLPLLRWAAAHAIRRDPPRWKDLLEQAQEVSARRGAPIISGLIDSIDVLDEESRTVLGDVAQQWSAQDVRRHAFELVAKRDGPEQAYALARDDPSRKNRSWAQSLQTASGVEDDRRRGREPSKDHDAPTLF